MLRDAEVFDDDDVGALCLNHDTTTSLADCRTVTHASSNTGETIQIVTMEVVAVDGQ